ncbi:hypothetical protein TUM17563_04670 [Klebsiella oxytoca]|nr:hypothetical protein TUM17563_04670 [Klebsiella oxytoca]
MSYDKINFFSACQKNPNPVNKNVKYDGRLTVIYLINPPIMKYKYE